MTRTAEQVGNLIELYKVEVARLEAEHAANGLTAEAALAWYSCKVSIANLYEELQALRIGNVERIRPGIERRRKPRKNVA